MPPTDPTLRLDRATTAVLVIDLQEKLLPAVREPERVVRATRLLLRAAALLGLPVLATTQYRRGLGAIVPAVAELLPAGAARLDKTAFSCFDEPCFPPLLRETAPAARTLLVAGVETHICVAGTARAALRALYGVEVVRDAVSARGAFDEEVGLKRMEAAGALVTSAEMAVYELLGGSGTPEFKELLPHLRGGS